MKKEFLQEGSFEPLQEGEDLKMVGALQAGDYPVFRYGLAEGNDSQPVDKIHHQIIALIEKGFGQTYGEDLSDEDVQKFLGGGEIYLLSTARREIIGLEVVKMLVLQASKIFFTAATVLHPDHQGKRLHTDFKEFIIQQEKPNFIAGRTQSPAVYRSYTHGTGTVYPNVGQPIPQEIQHLGQELASSLCMNNFDPATFIQRKAYGEGVYGQGTYPQIDPSLHPDLHQLFSRLHVEEGDAFLILKQIKSSP